MLAMVEPVLNEFREEVPAIRRVVHDPCEESLPARRVIRIPCFPGARGRAFSRTLTHHFP